MRGVTVPNTPEGVLALYLTLFRGKCFLPAARLARDHGLDEPLVRHAAFNAFCRFDDLHAKFPRFGFDDAALEVLAEFGFTLYFVPAPARPMLH